jgi:hypothetical protein
LLATSQDAPLKTQETSVKVRVNEIGGQHLVAPNLWLQSLNTASQQQLQSRNAASDLRLQALNSSSCDQQLQSRQMESALR